MTPVFTNIRVYPQWANSTLIEWDVHPEFSDEGPYNFTIQFSRDPATDEWVDVHTETDASIAFFSYTDSERRSWAVQEIWFYRIKLETAEGEYFSRAEPAWGSLDRADRLKFREISRQEFLRSGKFSGSKGQLYRRKHWGVVAPTGKNEDDIPIIDQITGDIMDPYNEISLGTRFVGGYWNPINYWISFEAGTTRAIVQGEIGTDKTVARLARACAYPYPRSRDLWRDCTAGKLHAILEVKDIALIRHVPVIVQLTMVELPYTDIAYKLLEPPEVEPDPEPVE